MKTKVFSLLFLLSLGFYSCNNDDDSQTPTITESVATENVFVMPIRKVVSGVSISEFESTRDAYVSVLEAEAGTLTDREMQPFGDFINFNFFTPDLDSVYVGLTSFQNATILGDINTKTASTPEGIAFFGSDGFGGTVFNFVDALIIKPLDPNEVVDLNDIAVLGSGQVWEIAVRDLSQYSDFDQVDYETKRDAYLAVLANQTAWVREIQWVDINNPSRVVGMTIYSSQQDYLDLQQNTTFTDEADATEFIQDYPINVYGGIHTVLK